MVAVHANVLGHVTGGKNPLLFCRQAILVLAVLIAQPQAISDGICVGNAHDGIIILTFRISKVFLERSILGVSYRRISDVRIVGISTSKHQPLIIRIIVRAWVYQAIELLFQTDVTILHHLVYDGLHLVHQVMVQCLTLQLTQLGLLAGHHLVVPDAHLLHQCRLVFIGGVLLVGHERILGSFVQFWSFVLHEGRIGVVKLQFALHEIYRRNQSPCLHLLVNPEVACHLSVLIDSETIAATQVAGESDDVIVIARLQALSFRGTEGDDRLLVAFKVARNLIPVHTFQDYLGDSRHLEIETDAAQSFLGKIIQ